MPVLYRYELEKKLKEQGFENWKEISRFLCDGDSDTYADHDLQPSQFAYQVVDNTKWMGARDAKFWQRLNRLWFVPLYLLTIPFQWLIRGRTGFSTTSKIAALFSRITGLE
ncbi:phage protein [Buttiauxella brennerae ATCC 51605]|uniref:Phage protein n=1 Tax=Buttiauxella brennerae ATCC 51605 TaxID=1354251 RepID=A0A1B7IQK3_9ENTR|nr:phage protein [Buttiauxella brennerae ATCC 51605]